MPGLGVGGEGDRAGTCVLVARGGGEVTLRIFDAKGRLVKTLIDGVQSEGEQSTTWNGLNDGGQQVATGVYFYRLTAQGFSQTRRMVLLK